MLINNNKVMSLLRCPKTGNSLTLVENKLVTKLEDETIEYEIIGKHPVLVNNEKSVIDIHKLRAQGQFINRPARKGVLRLLQKIISSPNETNKQNITQLLSLLADKVKHPRVLIVGGGTIGQGMNPFYEDNQIELVSFDIYMSDFVQFVADAHNIPIASEQFDVVIIQAVLEHVVSPAQVVSEIYRVLKVDGIVYAETPFLQHVHEGPYDFTRFTESGHRFLFRKFSLIDSGATTGAGTQLVWALDNFFRGLFRSKTIGKMVKIGFFWIQYFDKVIPDSYNIDSACGVYFLGRKQNIEITPPEIILHYKGAQ